MEKNKIEAPQFLKKFAKFASKSSIKPELQHFYCKGDTLYVTDAFKAARIKIDGFDCHGLFPAEEVATITKAHSDVTVKTEEDILQQWEGMATQIDRFIEESKQDVERLPSYRLSARYLQEIAAALEPITDKFSAVEMFVTSNPARPLCFHSHANGIEVDAILMPMIR